MTDLDTGNSAKRECGEAPFAAYLPSLLERQRKSSTQVGNSQSRTFVRQLAIQACIGLFDWEKATPQPLIWDLECELPSAAACRSDNIADTVDYAALIERLSAIALGDHCDLVEAMAERMAERMAEAIRREFAIPWLSLKLAVPRGAGGRLHRSWGRGVGRFDARNARPRAGKAFSTAKAANSGRWPPCGGPTGFIAIRQ